MASGAGWRSKLWIGVNGEALIGTELLCFSSSSLDHSLTQRQHLTTYCKYTCKYKFSHASKDNLM